MSKLHIHAKKIIQTLSRKPKTQVPKMPKRNQTSQEKKTGTQVYNSRNKRGEARKATTLKIQILSIYSAKNWAPCSKNSSSSSSSSSSSRLVKFWFLMDSAFESHLLEGLLQQMWRGCCCFCSRRWEESGFRGFKEMGFWVKKRRGEGLGFKGKWRWRRPPSPLLMVVFSPFHWPILLITLSSQIYDYFNKWIVYSLQYLCCLVLTF